jgi:hypothetical protein
VSRYKYLLNLRRIALSWPADDLALYSSQTPLAIIIGGTKIKTIDQEIKRTDAFIMRNPDIKPYPTGVEIQSLE